MKPLVRRTFLRGLGGAALYLPLSTSIGCKRSDPSGVGEVVGTAKQGLEFPKRFVTMYIPNGNWGHLLPPATNFTGTIFEPLQPFASKITVIKGVDMTVADVPPGEPHQTGMAMLTGRSLNEGDFVGGDGQTAGWASGHSLDQEIASVIGTDTAHKSLHFGVQSTAYGGTEVRTVMSYAGSDQPIANVTSPYNMYDLVFSMVGTDPAEMEALTLRRKSVLDKVGKQYEALIPRLSSDDKTKLEQHLTNIRDVEKRLDKKGVIIGGNCQVPVLGDPIDLDDPASFPTIGKLHMDLLVMSLACDQTRVATFQWSAATNNRPYPWLMHGGQPIVGDEHAMSHQPDTNTDNWAAMAVIRRWYMEQLAYLLGQLDGIPEGDGTLLDNTVVMLCSEVTRGNTHSHMDTPFLLAGGAGGAIQTGQVHNFEGTVPHNNLLVTLANAMGHPITTFGDPNFCTGPLAGILG